jgi:hypothetical protein
MRSDMASHVWISPSDLRDTFVCAGNGSGRLPNGSSRLPKGLSTLGKPLMDSGER